MNKAAFIHFLWSVASTIAGGLILAFLFFLSREHLFPIPELSGPWHIETCTVKTEFKQFEGMVLRYRAMLFREGSIIRGTAEKVYEDSNTLTDHVYVGSNRTRSVIDGHIEKQYLWGAYSSPT